MSFSCTCTNKLKTPGSKRAVARSEAKQNRDLLLLIHGTFIGLKEIKDNKKEELGVIFAFDKGILMMKRTQL